MIIEIIRYTVTPGTEPDFERACRGATQALEGSNACMGFSLTRSTVERNRYLMEVYWESPDGHLISFRQSSLFQDYLQHMSVYAEMIEESAHYRKTGIELTKKSLVRISGPPR